MDNVFRFPTPMRFVALRRFDLATAGTPVVGELLAVLFWPVVLDRQCRAQTMKVGR